MFPFFGNKKERQETLQKISEVEQKIQSEVSEINQLSEQHAPGTEPITFEPCKAEKCEKKKVTVKQVEEQQSAIIKTSNQVAILTRVLRHSHDKALKKTS